MKLLKNDYIVNGLGLIGILFIIGSVINTDTVNTLIARGQKPSLQMNTFNPPTTAPKPKPKQVAVPPEKTAQTSGIKDDPVALTGCTDEDIEQLVKSVSEQNLKVNMELLTKNNPDDNGETVSRYFSSPGNQQKAEAMKQYFESIGMQSTLQPFSARGKTIHNVIADLPGESGTDFYVVSSHIDSISGSKNPAPGADDNASGTALIMEAARVLKNFTGCIKPSIQFVGFNAEEVGLIGSSFYVQNLGDKVIKGNFNIDMVGYSGGSDCVDHNYKGNTNSEAITAKMIEVVKKYNLGLQGEIKKFSAPSDNESFTNKGLPAVSLHECTMSPQYHTENDTTKHISYSQLTKTTKAVVAAVAELSKE